MAGTGPMDNDYNIRVDQIASADEEQVLLSVPATDRSIEYERWI